MSSVNLPKLPSDNLEINWSDFYVACQKLAIKIVQHPGFNPKKTILFAIPRGGLTPAAVLAYILELKTVRTLPPISEIHRHFFDQHDFIIDSLFDTGKTYQDIRKQCVGTCNWAFVYCKQIEPPKDVLVGKKINTSNYLVFPWETGDENALYSS